jgi:hypothetical protein
MRWPWIKWLGAAAFLAVLVAAPVVGVILSAAPPGSRSESLFCSMTSSTSFSPYYVQVFNPTQSPGLCKDANRMFTEDEFLAIPGLKRQCAFDRDEQIKQQDGIVSIYSDQTQLSVVAARLTCRNAGNEIMG